MKMKWLLFFVPLLMFSCEDVYINGDLDGMWKLEMVSRGDSVEYPDRIYYSFQRHLVMLGEYYDERHPDWYMAEFDNRDGVLTMTKFYKYPGRDGYCDWDELKKYYIFSDTMAFVIDELDSRILLMHTEEHDYCFRKW